MLAVAVGAWAGCVERTPTSLDDTLLPGEPVTVELLIPWADFGSSLMVQGGYGAPSELGLGVVALQYGGSLEARTLVRHGPFPSGASVRDTTGTIRADSTLSFIGGRVVARFDTISSTNTGPVELALGALQSAWHSSTVTWTTAVDTSGVTVSWPEPGGGPVAALDTATWDPATGDSVWFELDSAEVAAWADTSTAARGARLDLLTPGERLQVRAFELWLVTRPSLNPDTLLELAVGRRALTFIYDPVPTPPPDGIRVGGAPSWRTLLQLAMPSTLNGPPELCDAVGCPATLSPERLNYAALVLTSRASPPAFQPTDTVRLDVRPVLAPSRPVKSPLGEVVAATRSLAPTLFGSGEGQAIEVPITAFVRDLLRGETASGAVPTSTLALLSAFEPLSIAFASFQGPGSAAEPVLRLLVTAGGAIDLP